MRLQFVLGAARESLVLQREAPEDEAQGGSHSLSGSRLESLEGAHASRGEGAGPFPETRVSWGEWKVSRAPPRRASWDRKKE